MKPKLASLKKLMGRSAFWHVAGALFLVAAIGAGIFGLRNYVDCRIVASAEPPCVVIKNRPAWMSDFVAQQISLAARPAEGSSVFNRQVLVDAAESLKCNPWIKQVKQLRRAYGHRPGDTIEIDCEYRIPVALVRYGDDYWLVDEEAVCLSDPYTAAQVPRVIEGPNRNILVRIIDGVTLPPPQPGQKWPGEDLAAGLILAKYLAAQSFADEIIKINMANFAGRKDPHEAQIVLVTRYTTEIRWGQPVDLMGDSVAEVRAAQKMDSLRRVYEQYRRVDANRPWLDVRFDRITYPNPEPAVAQARPAGRSR